MNSDDPPQMVAAVATLQVTVEIDTGANAAYLRFPDDPEPVATTLPIMADGGVLIGSVDVDRNGGIIGLEVLGAERRLPGHWFDRPDR